MTVGTTVERPVGARTSNRLGLMAGAGFIGGIIGFALSEMIMSNQTYSEYDSWESIESQIKTDAAIYFMLITLSIGVAIIAANHLIDKRAVARETVIIGLVSLIFGGLIAGYIAQSVYQSMLENADSMGDVRPARAVGWLIAGAVGGAAVGASFRTLKRVQNGVLGGAGGGLIGGALFDSFGSEGTARVFGVCVIGTLMSLLISTIDQARTNLWLEVVSGEMKGRLFLLMDETTVIGSDRSLQVCLLSDRSIQPRHLQLRFSNGAAEFSAIDSASILRNGAVAMAGRLADGEVIRVGNTDLRIGYLKTSSVSPTATTSYPSSHGSDASGPRPRMTAYEATHGGQPSGSGLNQSPPPVTKQPVARPRLQTKPRDQ
jgi:hypothetical protein